MYLVEGMGLEDPLVGRPNEDLKAQGLVLHVAVELRVRKQANCYSTINTQGIGLPGGKESACQCRRCRFDTWAGKIPQRRKWQATLVFLPGESPGQRSLAGYSPWGRKESDTA